nr:MAG TPA: hypothetical protein [Caudoviricetes sp.]
MSCRRRQLMRWISPVPRLRNLIFIRLPLDFSSAFY